MLARTVRGRVCHRHYSTSFPLVSIPKADIFKFGDAPPSPPLFAGLDWTIQDGEAWAIVGHGSARKTQLLETLRGNHRIHPPPPPPHGPWPALTAAGIDPYIYVNLVSFAHRAQSAGSDFIDYTARYGALREEDKTTLRTVLAQGMDVKSANMAQAEELAEKLGLKTLLDVPFIALSNGQTRRARIIKALLARPSVLLLDEPLTGLDVHTRTTVSDVLRTVHEAQAPSVLLGLRAKDPVPEWITHVVDVDPSTSLSSSAPIPERGVWMGLRTTWEFARESPGARSASSPASKLKISAVQPDTVVGQPMVKLQNVRVTYGDRPVLRGVSWNIHPGERWHLAGANGSGKTTLLALLTGEHPLSFAQRGASSLVLFGKPRQQQPAEVLARLVGRVSPEMADAVPRVEGRTVWDVVGTGFDGAFTPKGKAGVGQVEGEEQNRRVRRMWEVLQALGPASWTPSTSTSASDGELDKQTAAFANKPFVDLAPGERSLALLARALVGRPPLIILDEAWAGMDSTMVAAAHRFLRSAAGVSKDQAIIVVSHWAEEVPWEGDEVQKVTLEGGVAEFQE